MFYDILERKNLFLGYKKILVQKLKKIETIPKEVNPWFGQKMAIFPTSFLVIQTRKMSFMIFQNEKTSIYAIKTRSSKRRNIKIFQEELTHGFGQKLAILSSFCFQTMQVRKMCFTISQNEKTPLYVQKVEKMRFFQRGQPMVLVKNWQFFHLFFMESRPRKCVFQYCRTKKRLSRL